MCLIQKFRPFDPGGQAGHQASDGGFTQMPFVIKVVVLRLLVGITTKIQQYNFLPVREFIVPELVQFLLLNHKSRVTLLLKLACNRC